MTPRAIYIRFRNSPVSPSQTSVYHHADILDLGKSGLKGKEPARVIAGVREKRARKQTWKAAGEDPLRTGNHSTITSFYKKAARAAAEVPAAEPQSQVEHGASYVVALSHVDFVVANQ